LSRISIQGDASGTGTFTIQSPATNTDRTLTLPDEAGTVLTSVSDIESQVKTATNASGSAPVYACRAWVNFDGTGTLAINGSGNVSSVTDNGTGLYTVNFTNAMPDANYSFATSSFEEATSGLTTIERPTGGTRTVSALQVESAVVSNTVARTTRDNVDASVQVIR